MKDVISGLAVFMSEKVLMSGKPTSGFTMIPIINRLLTYADVCGRMQTYDRLLSQSKSDLSGTARAYTNDLRPHSSMC